MFLGAIFSVAIFVPGKEDEDVIRVVCAVLGVLALLFGVFYIKFMSARTRVLVELLLHRRQELRQPVLLVRKARGHIVGYGVYVRDLQGRKYKMQVLAEQDARAMLANIPP